jgi:N utilization substance protein A
MEISDLVNTIEGLTEEQAMEIVARAEVLAEEQTDELPRRKGSRGGAAASEPAPAVESFLEGDAETAVDSSAELEQGDDEFAQTDSDQSPTNFDAAIEENDSALPSELFDRIAGEPSPDDSTDSERDEASEPEIHDVALAVETSSYSPQGHEVTSPPSENDQGDGIRIVTEAVEQAAPKRASGASASNSRSDRAAESDGGRSEDVSS